MLYSRKCNCLLPTANCSAALRPVFAGTLAGLLAAQHSVAHARHSRAHRLHPALIRAVIKTESDFDPLAVSHAGAVGLMQLMPQTAMRFDVRDSYNPDDNIGGGTKYLRQLLDRFNGNLPLALAAYNAGEHAVERYRGLPPIPETRQYVLKVLGHYRTFLMNARASSSRAYGSQAPRSQARGLAPSTASR